MNIVNGGLKMKTKYRVKQEGNKFYPQYKKFLFWHNIYFPTMFENSYHIVPLKQYYFQFGLSFTADRYCKHYGRTLSDATALIDKWIECKRFKLSYKTHKIIKIYSNASRLRYLDVSTITKDAEGTIAYPFYSDNLDELKAKIDAFIQYEKTSKIRNIYPYGKD